MAACHYSKDLAASAERGGVETCRDRLRKLGQTIEK